MSSEHDHHNLRFYIVAVTLLVGVVFFFLFMNNTPLNLTSAIIGDSEKAATEESKESVAGTTDDVADDTKEPTTTYTSTKKETTKKSVKTSFPKGKEIDFGFSYSGVPEVNENVAVESLEIQFENLNTKIQVNKDLLELNNLQSVDLVMEGFSGTLEFDGSSISLDGAAKKIQINDVALSSTGEIEISFSNLGYELLRLNNVGIKALELPLGEGELNVGEKLTYSLDQENPKINYFLGDLTIDQSGIPQLQMEGTAQEILVEGKALNLVLN